MPSSLHVCVKLGLAFWSCALVAGPVDVAWVEWVRPRDLLPLPRSPHWPGRGLPVQFSQLMRWRTQVEWRAQSGWRRGCQCVKGWLCGGGFAPLTQEVSCFVGVVECHWCHCMPFGVVQAVLYYWHCLWISGGLLVVSQHFLENGHRWGTGWRCCGSVLAIPSIGYIKCTPLTLAATPLQRIWLNENGWISFTSWMSFLWFKGHLCHLVSLAS